MVRFIFISMAELNTLPNAPSCAVALAIRLSMSASSRRSSDRILPRYLNWCVYDTYMVPLAMGISALSSVGGFLLFPGIYITYVLDFVRLIPFSSSAHVPVCIVSPKRAKCL